MFTTAATGEEDKGPRALENEATQALPPPPRLRVLCVDDNEEASDSLGMLLEMVGCETSVAHNGFDALTQSATFCPQVGILDLTMPGMDGYELAHRLRSSPGGENVLLIALTAVSGYESMERMVESGFDLYYPKPLAPSTLYGVLNDFAERGRPR